MSKDLLKQLVVTEEDLLAEAVEKAKGLIAIEDKSGNVIVRLPKTSLPARTLIHLYLIGTYFSHRMGKTAFPSMSPTSLSLASGIDPSTISARLTELVNAGSVRKTERGPGKYPKGEYSINPYMMNELLDEILLSREKHSEPSSSANTFENGNPDSYPDIGKFDNLTTAISNLLQSPWGNTPRDWKEIQRALRRNSMIFSDGSVTGTLTLMYQDHRLRRVKEGRSFRYLVP
jgi:DNA-binding transcriptional ArsR family regulator